MYFNTGIFIGNSSHISVIGNNVTTNLYNGIVLYRSSYISITGSNIMENRYGIHLMDSSHNSIIGNNITFNIELGIYIEDSSFNSIYHNNFVNNTKHVYSTGSTNVWDDGYPSGGNYWSNYTDVDFYNGPNQDQPGSDGIWDHSYLIRDDNSDRYPFVNIIPEFPSTTILTIFMLMTTTLAVLARHRRLKHRR
jgi:parallel beta-helix repeat protein